MWLIVAPDRMSFEESVTIRTTKDWNTAKILLYKTYMAVISQHCDGILVFLHTSSTKLSDNVSKSNVYVTKQHFDRQHIFNKWNIVYVDSLGLIGSSPSNLMMNNVKIFEVLCSSRWHSCKCRESARRKHKLSLYGWPVLWKMRQLIVCFLSRNLVQTASLQPKGTSLSRKANTVEFVNLLNLQFEFILHLLQDSMKSVLFRFFLSFDKAYLAHSSLDRYTRVLFSCALKYLNPP